MLLNLDEIIEKLMHRKLMEFLNEQKITLCKQYRFHKDFQLPML